MLLKVCNGIYMSFFYLEKLIYFHDMEQQKGHFGPGFELGRLLFFSDLIFIFCKVVVMCPLHKEVVKTQLSNTHSTLICVIGAQDWGSYDIVILLV